jgi:guanyl-specific ribonuclease Sa
MSHETLPQLVDARIKQARSKAEHALTAASQACEQAAVRVAEAERSAALAKQVDARLSVEQVRAASLAQGQELADDLAAKGDAIKAWAAGAGY